MSDLPKGVYTRDINKKTKIRKSDVRLNRCIICYLYQNKPSEKLSSIFFLKITNMYQINHTKKVIDIWMSLENILGLYKKIVMKFKKIFLLLNMGCKLPLKIIYLAQKKTFWFNGSGLKNCLLRILWKQISQNEHNIREYDISSWQQQKNCQHKKLHTFTDRREKWISETMYRDIEKSFRIIHRNK